MGSDFDFPTIPAPPSDLPLRGVARDVETV